MLFPIFLWDHQPISIASQMTLTSALSETILGRCHRRMFPSVSITVQGSLTIPGTPPKSAPGGNSSFSPASISSFLPVGLFPILFTYSSTFHGTATIKLTSSASLSFNWEPCAYFYFGMPMLRSRQHVGSHRACPLTTSCLFVPAVVVPIRNPFRKGRF